MTNDTIKVLIIDDEAPLRRLTARMLGPAYTVAESGTGNEALQQVSAEEYDLLLVDHVLPDINGNDLVQRIRSAHPDQKVIYISGHTRETCLRPEELEDPATGFLQKPFTRDQLRHTVDVLHGSNT